MNRIDRLTAILIMLQARRVVRSQDIVERFGISRRTVYRDLRALQDAGVPIGAEAGIGYYLAPGYHLPPVMFSRQEAAAVLMAGKLMAHFSDASVNRAYLGALDKIRSVLDRPERRFLEQLDAATAVLATAPEDRPGFPNTFLPELQQALARRRVLTLGYHSASKDEETRRTVEPLGLCFYGTHWHLLAWCRLRGDYRDFRVDRIREVRDNGATFDRTARPGLPELIDAIFAAPQLQAVTVEFSPEVAGYVRDQKFYFGFMDAVDTPTGVRMQFLTADLTAMAHWLISFVDAVRIIEPGALRRQMARLAQRLARHYGRRGRH
jgi:predicted DNA-binding transcriptional regulator YafY